MRATSPDRSGAILISYDASGAHWQLGVLPPPHGEFALIGWTEPAEDGGAPAAVVDALARGLTRHGRVTFLCSSVTSQSGSQWIRQGADHVGRFRLAAGRGWRAALPAQLGGIALPLLSTVREEAVRGLFDDAGHPWWLQGQIALLSPKAAEPPKLATGRPLAAELIGEEWASCLSDLTDAGVDALLRPGVDGDVAGLVSRSHDIHRQLIEDVRHAAADVGLTCHVLTEDAFMERLAGG